MKGEDSLLGSEGRGMPPDHSSAEGRKFKTHFVGNGLDRNERAEWIQPLFDRVVVRLPLRQGVTEGGIILPERVRDQPNYHTREVPPLDGIVVAVGPGGVAPDGKHLKMMLNVGDRVLCTNGSTCGVRVWRKADGSGFSVKEDKDAVPYIIMGQYDLLAVVPEGG